MNAGGLTMTAAERAGTPDHATLSRAPSPEPPRRPHRSVRAHEDGGASHYGGGATHHGRGATHYGRGATHYGRGASDYGRGASDYGRGASHYDGGAVTMTAAQ